MSEDKIMTYTALSWEQEILQHILKMKHTFLLPKQIKWISCGVAILAPELYSR
jgi:hypothetical protein